MLSYPSTHPSHEVGHQQAPLGIRVDVMSWGFLLGWPDQVTPCNPFGRNTHLFGSQLRCK